MVLASNQTSRFKHQRPNYSRLKGRSGTQSSINLMDYPKPVRTERPQTSKPRIVIKTPDLSSSLTNVYATTIKSYNTNELTQMVKYTEKSKSQKWLIRPDSAKQLQNACQVSSVYQNADTKPQPGVIQNNKMNKMGRPASAYLSRPASAVYLTRPSLPAYLDGPMRRPFSSHQRYKSL